MNFQDLATTKSVRTNELKMRSVGLPKEHFKSFNDGKIYVNKEEQIENSRVCFQIDYPSPNNRHESL